MWCSWSCKLSAQTTGHILRHHYCLQKRYIFCTISHQTFMTGVLYLSSLCFCVELPKEHKVSVYNTAMPFPEVNFILWKYEDELCEFGKKNPLLILYTDVFRYSKCPSSKNTLYVSSSRGSYVKLRPVLPELKH